MVVHMTRKFLIILVLFCGAAIAAGKAYSVTLYQRSVIAGVELEPGEYKLEWNGSKATLRNGRKAVEAEVKVETGDQKYSSTSVRYQNGDGSYHIQEIRLGGGRTKLVFN